MPVTAMPPVFAPVPPEASVGNFGKNGRFAPGSSHGRPLAGLTRSAGCAWCGGFHAPRAPAFDSITASPVPNAWLYTKPVLLLTPVIRRTSRLPAPSDVTQHCPIVPSCPVGEILPIAFASRVALQYGPGCGALVNPPVAVTKS